MLKIFNTMSRKKVSFEPIHPPFVGMYVCGPTVYDDPHLGHAKSYISFDVMVRFLRFLGYRVRYVQNITDVGHLLDEEQGGEDRIIKRARLEKLEPIEVAQKYERRFFKDMDSVNNLRPDISCRASGHIPDMVSLVKTLIQKGYGYEAEGNVYFDVSKFGEYGKLTGRRVEDLMEGVRVNVAEGKRQAADFALWKKAEPGHIMQWDSPWSRGYPGWHLECSVMAMKYIGESVDIHGGGLDNQFPHHECEIAQSEAATGKPFVKYWIHNNMVTLNGQKMSKSLGNHITLQELFQTFSPMTVRFFVLQGHYRSPQDFSDKALEGAGRGFERLAGTVAIIRSVLKDEFDIHQNPVKLDKLTGRWKEHRQQFDKYMNDDFNTAGAISVLFDVVKSISAAGASVGDCPPEKSVSDMDPESLSVWKRKGKQELLSADTIFRDLGEGVLGLSFEEKAPPRETRKIEADLMDLIILLRRKARESKDFKTADQIRESLSNLGIELQDGREGTRWIKK
jgi:cysteinyl-tRNA synthetase